MEFQRQPRESKRKRFKPWENIRRMFQRKTSSASDHQPKGRSSSSSRLSGVLGLATTASRSRSTSELLTTEPIAVSSSNRVAAPAVGSLGAGLSVSHDSVFDLDISPESETYSPAHHRHHRMTHESLPSSASLQYMSELRAAIGNRHRSSEDDEGLPRSPKNAPPTTAQILLDSMVHQSNAGGRGSGAGGGSDPSLLSINSCELEEAPFSNLAERNQQPQPLLQQPQQQAGKLVQQRPPASHNQPITDGRLDQTSDDGLLSAAASLNHSAARHKISIRPKRNHAPARPRQLPQLAESSVEAVVHPLLASHHPDDGQDLLPSAPERKNRTTRRAEPVSPSTYNSNKPRSVSLSRTEDAIIRELPLSDNVVDPDPNHPSKATGSSSVKLARSKSSVEKKIQHEVAVFWRRTKEGKLFNRKENSDHSEPKETAISMATNQDGSKSNPVENDQVKRKDLRKIKRDKEEKRKKSDASVANKEDSSPPFLSRIFGSRRSGRRKKTPTPPSPVPDQVPLASPSPVPVPVSKTEPVPVPKPRTIFHPPVDDDDDDDDEPIDWSTPHSPYHFAPAASTTATAARSIPPALPVQSSSRLLDKWAETDLYIRAPMTSPKLGQRAQPMPVSQSTSVASEEFQMRAKSPSPLPTRHHRIHIAGLSPFQRRVARVGNGLEISDEEWDEPEVASRRSYHFRADERAQLTMSLNPENQSLPVNINQDFILKKASPVETPSPPVANNDLMRRSFEILKFGNEGLKKTIDSLNPKRMSQSSDQLHLSDASGGRRGSSASLSNSTSSLDISDADDTMDTNGSMISLLQSADEKDAHDEDILIVDHHKESSMVHEESSRSETSHGQHSWSELASTPVIRKSELNSQESLASDHPSSSHHHHPDIPKPVEQLISNRPENNNSGGGVGDDSAVFDLDQPEIRIKHAEVERVKPKQKTWESRQMAHLDPPMFSMSVRVQNPPEVKFKRSLSTPANSLLVSSPLSVQQPESTTSSVGAHHHHHHQNQAETAAIVGRKSLDTTYNASPRPFIMSVRMGSDGGDGNGPTASALPAQQLMAKLSARPWQSKEDKDRQNKVALGVVKSQPELPPVQTDHQQPTSFRTPPVEPVSHSATSQLLLPDELESTPSASTSYPADVKLRQKKSGSGGAQEETSELLKVFARRSLKIRDSADMTDANIPTQETALPDTSSTSGSASPAHDNRVDNVAVDLFAVQQTFESTEQSKLKKIPKPLPPPPPVVGRQTAASASHEDKPEADRVLKSSGKPPLFFRSTIQESSYHGTDNTVVRPLIRQPMEGINVDPAAVSADLKNAIGVSSRAEKSDDETGRSNNSSPPEEVIWKRQGSKLATTTRPNDRFAPKFPTKTLDEEVKAATAVPPTRQSKVLDMVHNFQRLQVT